MKLKTNQSGFAHPVAIGVVALTLAVVGFTGYRVATMNDKSKLNSTEQQQTTEDALPVSLDGLLPVSKVSELAVGSTATTVSNVELESEHGQLVYKVTLSDGSVVMLNAKTGAKVTKSLTVSSETEDEQDALPAGFTTTVSFLKAREIALAKFPNGTVTKISLGVEQGKVVLSVRFADKARVDVDAKTGEVVRVKNPAGKTDEKSSSDATTSSSSTSSRRSSDDTKSTTSGSDDGNDSSDSNSGSGSGSSSSDDGDDSGDDSGSNDDSSGSHSGRN